MKTRCEKFDVKKIAVLRANAVGDYIFAVPALEALKQQYPDAELVYLGKAWHRSFLTNRPGPVDRVVVVPKCDGIPHEKDRLTDQKEADRFFENMQREEFDIAFQMHGGGRHSNPFTKRLGAKLTVGFQDTGAPPLDINVPYHLYQHEVLRYLELVKMVGVEIKNLEPGIALTELDMEELSSCFTDSGEPYAVIHPGASDIHRQWPPEKFARVGDYLAGKGLKVFISGTESERAIVESVIGHMIEEAGNLCGKLSLNAMTALLAKARLVVSNDTGPLYLARALSTPTVGIYWIGNLITGGAVSVAKNRCCISWRTNCPLCGVDCIKIDVHYPSDSCDHRESFVNDVDVEEVVRHVHDLLFTSNGLNRDMELCQKMGIGKSLSHS